MHNQCKFSVAALIVALVCLTGTLAYGDYICGDANSDEAVNVADAVWIINYVFASGDPPNPLDAGDTNCDGSCNITDAVWIINYIFAGGYTPCDTDGDGFPDCGLNCPGTVVDIDGNVYQTVLIGGQCWMAENLKVTHYRNGDPIPNVTDVAEWIDLSTGAYCDYYNDPANVPTYGRLYNWYAVDDSRNIAPEGWHLPSDAEWKQLEMYLGMSQAEADSTLFRGTDEGGKLKEAGYAHWIPPNEGATNESGFTALPGGFRDYDGSFYCMGITAFFWSSTEFSSGSAWIRGLYYNLSPVNRYYSPKHYGLSVRCVKD